MANKMSRGYLFVAIDRASRRVFIAMYRHKTAANAQRCLGDLERTGPIRIRTILPEKAFTDRLFGVRGRAATRQPAFETLCSTLGIEPQLTPPRSLQTNRMVERFNGRLEDVSMFDLAKGWGCTAKSGFTTARLHNQLWAAKLPCTPSNNGTNANRQLFTKQPCYLTECDN